MCAERNYAIDFVGVAEIAKMAGVSRSVVNMWTERYRRGGWTRYHSVIPPFPEVAFSLGMGRGWWRGDIADWLKTLKEARARDTYRRSHVG